MNHMSVLRRAVELETAAWRSLGRWLLRRPDVAPGDTPFGYHGSRSAMLVIAVLSALEVLLADLLVPWQSLQPAVLVLGVWRTGLMLGLVAGVLVCPHAMGPRGLRVRHGAGLDVRIPWDAVAGVRRLRRSRHGRGVQLEGSVLHVAASGQTTVEVALNRPFAVMLPGGRVTRVREIRFHADDSAGLVTAARARLGADAARRRSTLSQRQAFR